MIVETSARGGARSSGRGRRSRSSTTATLAFDESLVFANQQIEVRTFLVGKLQKDLFALGVLESFAVLLEEAMRAALASDADHERLLIVDTTREPLGAFRKEAVGGALEEEERRSRLELWIALQQLRISCFEFDEVLLLLEREVLKDLAPARIAGQPRSAGVEVETAAFGRNRDPQRIAGEHQIGVTAFEG